MKKLLSTIVLSTVLLVSVQAQTKLISARLYGAIPNDGNNDKPTLKYLIRKVSAMQNTYIVLEPGKYDVKKLHIDYEILQDMGRISDNTPTPEGYNKMFYIFLVPKNTDVVMNVK